MKLKLRDCYKQVGNNIFWLGQLQTIKRKYEYFTDSKGITHSVVVDVDHLTLDINENDYIYNDRFNIFELIKDSSRFQLRCASFQLNLEEYDLYHPKDYVSLFQEIRNISNDNVDIEWVNHNYRLRLGEYYFPLYETIYGASNHYVIENTISDKLFFNFHDRKQALENIDGYSREKLMKLGYDKMNDKEVLGFMTKRFHEYINLKKQYPNLF